MKISAVDPVGIADGDGRKLELCLIDHDEVGYNIVLEIAGMFEEEWLILVRVLPYLVWLGCQQGEKLDNEINN